VSDECRESALTLHTQLLIVGAGPYGLATAALARRNGIDTMVCGRRMDFWKNRGRSCLRTRHPALCREP
jgi:2-polyprenyl-6-methoxyphenol hydroxylase-like FAD-dependent oxidoreductase